MKKRRRMLVGVFAWKGWKKEKVKRGVFLCAASFTKPPHGPR